MAFPVIKYCRANLGELEEVTLDSEDADATGDDAVGFESEAVGVASLPFEASAKSSGRFKALRTSTISS